MLHWLLLGVSVAFMVAGAALSGPGLLEELKTIVLVPDHLLTDYMAVAGVGGALFNSGALMAIFTLALRAIKVQLTGISVAAIMTVGGFALFGKNLANVWPIVAGVLLYTVAVGENVKAFVYVALFGTALAPVVTHLVLHTELGLLGVGLSTLVGFLLPPTASFCLTLHRGYNLYNVGFTAGMLGTIAGALMKTYDAVPKPSFFWHSQDQALLFSFSYLLFFAITAVGFWRNGFSLRGYGKLTSHSGKLLSDFVLLEGEGPAVLNVGIMGLIFTTLLLVLGIPLNGPTLGGVMTVAGFSAVGKHPKNALPVVAGILLGAATNKHGIRSPSMALAMLFGTTLAPIAGEFGAPWGVLAGFLHSAVVTSVGFLHEGMNLYNNGFSGGVVALFLIPLIESFRRIKESLRGDRQ